MQIGNWRSSTASSAEGDYTFVNLVEDGTDRVLASIAVDRDIELVS